MVPLLLTVGPGGSKIVSRVFIMEVSLDHWGSAFTFNKKFGLTHTLSCSSPDLLQFFLSSPKSLKKSIQLPFLHVSDKIIEPRTFKTPLKVHKSLPPPTKNDFPCFSLSCGLVWLFSYQAVGGLMLSVSLIMLWALEKNETDKS